MNINQKSRYISSLHKSPPYPKYKSFHWADYIELLCLANLDEELSVQDIVDRLTERIDLGESKFYEDETESIEDDTKIGSRQPEISDKLEIEVSDWFKLLQVRSSLYGTAYPFIITDNEIKRKRQRFTKQQKLYVYLLLCSNLYLFEFDTRINGILANSFELISHSTLKKILPSQAVSHLFGSNPLNRTGKYGSRFSFWQKINQLADDLFSKLHPEVDELNYPSNHRGDDGLDIVAWIPTGEPVSNSLIFLAQCACRPNEWITKQSQSSYDAWSNKIVFTTYTNNIMFIPFCFRRADKNWFRAGDIRKSFLVDRKRIIFYLTKEYKDFSKLPAASIVENVIGTKEGVV